MKIEDNLYDILGIDADASQEEIKKAYRENAVKTHPDKGGTDTEFSKVSLAYNILSDPDKRKQYDRDGITSETTDVEKAAISHIKSLVAQAVKQNCEESAMGMFYHRNGGGIAKLVQTAIKKQIADTTTSIHNAEDAISKLEGSKPKFRMKKKAKRKSDIFTSTVDELIENSKNFKAQAENQLKMLKMAAEIASDYEDVAVVEKSDEWKDINVGMIN